MFFKRIVDLCWLQTCSTLIFNKKINTENYPASKERMSYTCACSIFACSSSSLCSRSSICCCSSFSLSLSCCSCCLLWFCCKTCKLLTRAAIWASKECCSWKNSKQIILVHYKFKLLLVAININFIETWPNLVLNSLLRLSLDGNWTHDLLRMGRLQLTLGGGPWGLRCCPVFCAVLQWSQTLWCAMLVLFNLWCSVKQNYMRCCETSSIATD